MDKPIGEVSVQIELHTHPKSGERKVTARGLFEFFVTQPMMSDIFSQVFSVDTVF